MPDTIKCPKDGTTLVTLEHFTRFYKCRECFRVFWHDGPSLLGERDASRKLDFSGDLLSLSEVQVAMVASL